MSPAMDGMENAATTGRDGERRRRGRRTATEGMDGQRWSAPRLPAQVPRLSPDLLLLLLLSTQIGEDSREGERTAAAAAISPFLSRRGVSER